MKMLKKLDKSKLTNDQKARIHKSNMRLLIGLIIGVILFMIPSSFDMYMQWRQYPMVQYYDKKYQDSAIDDKNIKEYNKQVIDYQKGLRGKITADVSKYTGPDEPMGYINIPAIKAKNLLIYHGTSDEILARGLGNMEFTSLPTGGKNTLASITGHTGLANRVFFDNIKFLKKGDEIELDTLGHKLRYAVTSKKVINPNKKGALNNFYVQKNKDKIALMTCTPAFINSHRLIVYAKRIPDGSPSKRVIRRDFWSFVHIWQVVVVLFLLIFIFAYMYQRYRYRKMIENTYTKKQGD